MVQILIGIISLLNHSAITICTTSFQINTLTFNEIIKIFLNHNFSDYFLSSVEDAYNLYEEMERISLVIYPV